MKKEQDILKWFEGKISTEEMKSRYAGEELSTLEKIGFYAKQIEIPEIDAQQALDDFKDKTIKKKDPQIIPLNFKMIYKVVAILVVMLTSTYFLFFNNADKLYETQIAETKHLKLPDNSQVILNAQSTLQYNKKTWKEKRDMELDGEAFFKVQKGEKFTVKTSAGTVQVLGTQFNVKERDNYFEVQCYEGSVHVQYGNEVAILSRGKSFRVVHGEIAKTDDFKSQQPSWLAQESSFNNVPLWQVIDELEIQYHMVIVDEHIDTSVKFTGSFTHNDRHLALQSVTIPLKLSYKIDGEKVVLYTYEAN